jgi:hypothetical protein
VLVAASLAVTGCSDADEGEAQAPATATTLVPSSTGDRCDDPRGDLDVPPGVPEDALGALAGIDLVTAAATVEGEELQVAFDVAGPIADVAAPTFVVAQGDPLESLSFELRLARTDAAWASELITWPSGREERRDAGLVVVADGARLTTALPLAELPPIALSLQFGAAAELSDGLVVIDDCSSLAPG